MQLLKSNAGKIGLVVVLLAAAVAIFVFSGRGGPSRATATQFVCVASGQTFSFDRGTSKILPVVNPDTGQKTLLPCHKGADGNLYVSDRCRSLVEQLEKDGINKYVDPQTLLVRAKP